MNSRIYDKKVFEKWLKDITSIECDWCNKWVNKSDLKLVKGKLMNINKRVCEECYRDYQLKELGL